VKEEKWKTITPRRIGLIKAAGCGKYTLMWLREKMRKWDYMVQHQPSMAREIVLNVPQCPPTTDGFGQESIMDILIHRTDSSLEAMSKLNSAQKRQVMIEREGCPLDWVDELESWDRMLVVINREDCPVGDIERYDSDALSELMIHKLGYSAENMRKLDSHDKAVVWKTITFKRVRLIEAAGCGDNVVKWLREKKRKWSSIVRNRPDIARKIIINVPQCPPVTDGLDQHSITQILINRLDSSLDAMSKLDSEQKRQVMIGREGCPLDWLDELDSWDRALVALDREDCPIGDLDRYGSHALSELMIEKLGYSDENMRKLDSVDKAVVMMELKDCPLDFIGTLNSKDLATLMIHRPGCPLDLLWKLNSKDKAKVMIKRIDCPLDLIDTLDMSDLADVMTNRIDCPLEYLDKLPSFHKAAVMVNRQDCPLDARGLNKSDQRVVIRERRERSRVERNKSRRKVKTKRRSA